MRATNRIGLNREGEFVWYRVTVEVWSGIRLRIPFAEDSVCRRKKTLEPDAPFGFAGGRLHQLSDRVEDYGELIVVLRLQLNQLPR